MVWLPFALHRMHLRCLLRVYPREPHAVHGSPELSHPELTRPTPWHNLQLCFSSSMAPAPPPFLGDAAAVAVNSTIPFETHSYCVVFSPLFTADPQFDGRLAAHTVSHARLRVPTPAADPAREKRGSASLTTSSRRPKKQENVCLNQNLARCE